ncbi:hypothetical protein AVEN_193212-1 [Araneus ventricosus]|uniref:Uncharacterized protein n=1 Tax=Araneus ventricosus TaxID=182803 RepID=A0A4Y2B2S2_ARAVE|nr:hypothetical protein AVEN_193212-1 [Araneus ventricosus]
MDLVILNHGQMTKTTPELVFPLQTSSQHQREDVELLRMTSRATGRIHDGSSVVSGFEPGTSRLRCQNLTTRSPRPVILINFPPSHIPEIQVSLEKSHYLKIQIPHAFNTNNNSVQLLHALNKYTSIVKIACQ